MHHRLEAFIIIIAVILLTVFSASFADPAAASQIASESAFYGRNILKETPETSSQSDSQSSTEVTDHSKEIDPFFWGVPDFSHQ